MLNPCPSEIWWASIDHHNWSIDMARILLDEIESTDNLEDKIALYRARCCHLRDDTSKVKAKAYNLLNEDVLEYLKLIESALNRPKPKTEVALHYTQIMIDDVEAAIPFFDDRPK